MDLKTNLKNESGMSAVVAVIVIGSLALIFSSSLTLSTIIGSENSINKLNSDNNYYIAESGVEDSLRIFLLDPTYDPIAQVESPIGNYSVEITPTGGGNYSIHASVEDSRIVRSATMGYKSTANSVPDSASFAMFAGQELQFLHVANSPGRTGTIKGDIFAKDRVKFVRFKIGWEDGSKTTNIISAGSYGGGDGVGSLIDRLNKNNEIYYTNFYTYNDVDTHTSAYANYLNIYYKDSRLQSINLPSGPNSFAIADPNMNLQLLRTPQLDFSNVCTQDAGEAETVYTYTDNLVFRNYVISRNGTLDTGIHCILSGDVLLDYGKEINLTGSIVVPNGALGVIDKTTITDGFNIPVFASFGDLTLGKIGNSETPNDVTIIGVIFSESNVYITNFAAKSSVTTPKFELVGGIWAVNNLIIDQHSSLQNLIVDITFESQYTESIRGFTTQNINGIKQLSWEENFN